MLAAFLCEFWNVSVSTFNPLLMKSFGCVLVIQREGSFVDAEGKHRVVVNVTDVGFTAQVRGCKAMLRYELESSKEEL